MTHPDDTKLILLIRIMSSEDSPTDTTPPLNTLSAPENSGLFSTLYGTQTGMQIPQLGERTVDSVRQEQVVLDVAVPSRTVEPEAPWILYSVVGGAAVIFILSMILMRKAKKLLENRTALPLPHVFFSVFAAYAVLTIVLSLTVMESSEDYWTFRFFFWAVLATIWGKLFALELSFFRPQGKQKKDLHYKRHAESLRFEPYESSWILGGIGFSMVGFGWVIGETQPVGWSVLLGGPLAAIGAGLLFAKLWKLVRGDWQSFAFIGGWLLLGLLSVVFLLFPSPLLGAAVIGGEILVLALCMIPPHSNFSGIMEKARMAQARDSDWVEGAIPKLYQVQKQNQLLDDPNFESDDFEITDKTSLRTEPGRKKKDKIDPWTGLEVDEEAQKEKEKSLLDEEEFTEEEFFAPIADEEESMEDESLYDDLEDYMPDAEALDEEEDPDSDKRKKK